MTIERSPAAWQHGLVGSLSCRIRATDYLTPPLDSDLWTFGCDVIGRDASTGRAVEGFAPEGYSPELWKTDHRGAAALRLPRHAGRAVPAQGGSRRPGSDRRRDGVRALGAPVRRGRVAGRQDRRRERPCLRRVEADRAGAGTARVRGESRAPAGRAARAADQRRTPQARIRAARRPCSAIISTSGATPTSWNEFRPHFTLTSPVAEAKAIEKALRWDFQMRGRLAAAAGRDADPVRRTGARRRFRDPARVSARARSQRPARRVAHGRRRLRPGRPAPGARRSAGFEPFQGDAAECPGDRNGRALARLGNDGRSSTLRRGRRRFPPSSRGARRATRRSRGRLDVAARRRPAYGRHWPRPLDRHVASLLAMTAAWQLRAIVTAKAVVREDPDRAASRSSAATRIGEANQRLRVGPLRRCSRGR